jgi:hypothetical protein
MPKLKTDRYTVRVSGEAFDTIAAVLDAAINEARERAKIFAIPATWGATVVSGKLGDWEIIVRVTRKRNA